jgi:5-methylcytosine-specific restriction endonuclease McrA
MPRFPIRLRSFILERDGHKCSECGYSSNSLCVHHKDRNPKNNSLDNLITLCKSCHSKEHGMDKIGITKSPPVDMQWHNHKRIHNN